MTTFKCPKCSFKGAFKQVQKHYYANHYKPKIKKDRVKVFRPTLKRR